MKKKVKIFVIILVLLVTLPFTITKVKADIGDWILYKKGSVVSYASWDFMQAVGGIKVESNAKKKGRSIYLPITCDVSGLSAITKKPTTMNSGISVYKIKTKVENNQILVTIILGPIGITNATPMCQSEKLKNFSPGKYDVFYYYAGKKYFIGNTIIP